MLKINQLNAKIDNKQILKFPGHKLKQDQQLHGNTQVAYLEEIIQLVNFIQLQSQTTIKKQIQVLK